MIEPGDDQTAVRYALFRAAEEATHGKEVDLIVNTVVEIDGDRAWASSVRLRLGETDRAPQLITCDRIYDELVRLPSGQWKIAPR